MARVKLCLLTLLGCLLMMGCSSSEGEYEVREGKVFFNEWTFSYGDVTREVKDADASTFRDLGNAFGKDAHHCFCHTRLLEGADATTFQTIRGRYARDARHVYYQWYVVEGADPETFRVTGLTEGKDKNHHYFEESVSEE